MAAIITSANITVLQHPSLKHPPPSTNPTHLLALRPSSICWSAERGIIFLSFVDGTLAQYDVASESLQDISVTSRSSTEPIISLHCKDRGGTVIYGQGQQVVVLSTASGKPANTFDTHKAPITSLSLSNDSSLLASTSARAIHVHNLTLASHTVLRGIPAATSAITACAFHPHSRTRLLVGLGSQLLVYDTTRPSAPAKVIDIDKDKKNLGAIVAISCSPFSKTLVAVGCSGGTIALIDLEKEKGLFRTVLVPAPITCLSFSAEGAAIYAGTENGKFLILDLRALDRPPKSVTISENGDRVVALCVQKKLKHGEAQPKPTISGAVNSKPLVQRDVNKAPATSHPSGTNEAMKKSLDKESGKAQFKTRPKADTGVTDGTGNTNTPRRTAARTASASSQAGAAAGRGATGRPSNRAGPKSPVVSRPSGTEAQRRAFSPPKSPVTLADKKVEDTETGDLSDYTVRIENLLALPKMKESAAPAAVDEALQAAAPSRAPSVLSRASSRSQASHSGRERMHARPEPTSHATTAESISTGAPRVRSGSSASVTGRASKTSMRSVMSNSSASPVRPQSRRVSGSTVSRSRTPSPELPDIDDAGPVTPIPAYKMKGKERAGALGLNTPELDEWIRAGEAREVPREGKRVGFAGAVDDEKDDAGPETGRLPSPSDERDEDADYGRNRELQREGRPRSAQPELAMQISPRRSFPGPSASSRWAAVPSPLRNPASGGSHGPVPASPQARAAQDMLQALLRDALHDFRAETKAEIVGLHLDLIRMGSSWRREMQEALGGFGEELRALREENARLREENERLRRGY
ncbi:WD40-repeat-containing domain protein [Trametes punicea]|nr:WD40-repeat-containing domain protein [Trametes punicea]